MERTCNLAAINELKNHSLWKYTGSSGEQRMEISASFMQMMNEHPQLLLQDKLQLEMNKASRCPVQLRQRGYH